jgi:hypothetical protein
VSWRHTVPRKSGDQRLSKFAVSCHRLAHERIVSLQVLASDLMYDPAEWDNLIAAFKVGPIAALVMTECCILSSCTDSSGRPG